MFASKFSTKDKRLSSQLSKTPTGSQFSAPVNLSISNLGAHDRLSTPNLSERRVTAQQVKSKIQFKL